MKLGKWKEKSLYWWCFNINAFNNQTVFFCSLTIRWPIAFLSTVFGPFSLHLKTEINNFNILIFCWKYDQPRVDLWTRWTIIIISQCYVSIVIRVKFYLTPLSYINFIYIKYFLKLNADKHKTNSGNFWASDE